MISDVLDFLKSRNLRWQPQTFGDGIKVYNGPKNYMYIREIFDGYYTVKLKNRLTDVMNLHGVKEMILQMEEQI